MRGSSCLCHPCFPVTSIALVACPGTRSPTSVPKVLCRSSTPFFRLNLSSHSPQVFMNHFICCHTFRRGHVSRRCILTRIPSGCEPSRPTIRHYAEAGSRVLSDCCDVTVGHQNRRAVRNLTNGAVFFIDWPAQILMWGQL